jgi:hypothetical protein
MDAEWAWAAGLFEGEGCVASREQKGKTYHRLVVRMTDEDVIRHLHRVIGRGSVYGPYAPSKVGRKPVWEWSCTSRLDISFIVAMFWPWLGDRRRQRIREVIGPRFDTD